MGGPRKRPPWGWIRFKSGRANFAWRDCVSRIRVLRCSPIRRVTLCLAAVRGLAFAHSLVCATLQGEGRAGSYHDSCDPYVCLAQARYLIFPVFHLAA